MGHLQPASLASNQLGGYEPICPRLPGFRLGSSGLSLPQTGLTTVPIRARCGSLLAVVTNRMPVWSSGSCCFSRCCDCLFSLQNRIQGDGYTGSRQAQGTPHVCSILVAVVDLLFSTQRTVVTTFTISTPPYLYHTLLWNATMRH